MDPSTDELLGFLYDHKSEFIIGIVFLVLQVIPPIALRFLKKADRTTDKNDTYLLKRLQSSNIGQYCLFNSSLVLATHMSITNGIVWLGQMVFGLAILVYTQSVLGLAMVMMYGTILYIWHLRQIKRYQKFVLGLIKEAGDLSAAIAEAEQRQ